LHNQFSDSLPALLGVPAARTGQLLTTYALGNHVARATDVQLEARVLAFTSVVFVLNSWQAFSNPPLDDNSEGAKGMNFA
jgi:hypothetical protein